MWLPFQMLWLTLSNLDDAFFLSTISHFPEVVAKAALVAMSDHEGENWDNQLECSHAKV